MKKMYCTIFVSYVLLLKSHIIHYVNFKHMLASGQHLIDYYVMWSNVKTSVYLKCCDNLQGYNSNAKREGGNEHRVYFPPPTKM